MRKMRYTCIKDNNHNTIKLFLELPSKLYDKNTLTQDKKTERLLLEGRHLLSSDFRVMPFVVVDASHKTVSRCMLTYYPDDENAYVGFFESFHDEDAVKLLFEEVIKQAVCDKKKQLIGPLNASFWLGYRFKMGVFDEPFTGEPYNRDYYVSLWKMNGFEITDRYYSNHLRIPTPEDRNEKCIQKYEAMKDLYEFKHPTFRTFDAELAKIYELLIELYSGFPAFQPIEKTKFMAMYSSLKYVLNYDMVELVYQDGKLVAFLINIPNYGNLTCGGLTAGRLVKILKRKRTTKEYILMYLGVDNRHLGLGSALAQITKEKLEKKKCASISALIHEGKPSGTYYRELTDRKYEYVLMKRSL